MQCDIAYMWNLKKKRNDTNVLIYKAEPNLPTYKQIYGYLRGKTAAGVIN